MLVAANRWSLNGGKPQWGGTYAAGGRLDSTTRFAPSTRRWTWASPHRCRGGRLNAPAWVVYRSDDIAHPGHRPSRRVENNNAADAVKL
jgi:hypothetical protein